MGTISERHIIDLGRGSFVITLPKPWVKFHGLKPRDTVLVVTSARLRVKVLKRKVTLRKQCSQ